MDKDSLTREEAEEIFGCKIDDSLWKWIVDNNRQQEIIDSAGKER